MIKYSFIIPHKNCPELLKRCVDSIPLRDDVQIIVVDDNSEKGKKPLINREKVEYVILDKQQSKGAGRARNVGIERAIGKWLLFPDSDDYYVENFLTILDAYVDEDVDVVYFNSEFRDGQTKAILPPLPFHKEFEKYDDSQEAIETIKFHHNVPWTKMIKREYVQHYNFKFEEVPNGNDIFFSMSIGYCTDRIKVIKQPLYVYLRNSNSITNKLAYNKSPQIDTLCFLKHQIQLNRFYKFIGHQEWQLSELGVLLKFIKICRLSFPLHLKDVVSSYIGHRNDLIILIKNYKQFK